MIKAVDAHIKYASFDSLSLEHYTPVLLSKTHAFHIHSTYDAQPPNRSP